MNPSNNNDQINNLNNAIDNIYKYLLPVIYILGNIGNLLSALIFSRKSWKKNVCVFYFKVCLLFNTCYINSRILGMMLTNSFNIYLQDTNIVLCKLYIYTSYLFVVLLPTVLILASIDRLLISSQNVDTRLYSSKRLAYFSISISVAIWSISNIHYLIKANIQEVSPSYFLCAIDLSKSYRMFVSYCLAAINLIACFIMIILCIIAFKNVRRIRAIRRDRHTHQIRSMTKKDFQLLRCLYAEDIIYIIFSIMVTSYNVYLATITDQKRTVLDQAIQNFIRHFFDLLFFIPYTSNFFVFMTISKAFRHELKCIIYKNTGKQHRSIREEENKPNNVKLDVAAVSTIELSK
jgi:hypothetical protein